MEKSNQNQITAADLEELNAGFTNPIKIVKVALEGSEEHTPPTYEEIVRFLNARRTFLEAGGRIGRAKEIGYILDRIAAHKLVNRDINS